MLTRMRSSSLIWFGPGPTLHRASASSSMGCPCLSWINRWTHFATFFANLARVMGPGGLRKSFVGICLLHCRYPGHSSRIDTLGPRPSKTVSSRFSSLRTRECKASESGIPHSEGFSTQKWIGASMSTSSTYRRRSLFVCGLYISCGTKGPETPAEGRDRASLKNWSWSRWVYRGCVRSSVLGCCCCTKGNNGEFKSGLGDAVKLWWLPPGVVGGVKWSGGVV